MKRWTGGAGEAAAGSGAGAAAGVGVGADADADAGTPAAACTSPAGLRGSPPRGPPLQTCGSCPPWGSGYLTLRTDWTAGGSGTWLAPHPSTCPPVPFRSRSGPVPVLLYLRRSCLLSSVWKEEVMLTGEVGAGGTRRPHPAAANSDGGRRKDEKMEKGERRG